MRPKQLLAQIQFNSIKKKNEWNGRWPFLLPNPPFLSFSPSIWFNSPSLGISLLGPSFSLFSSLSPFLFLPFDQPIMDDRYQCCHWTYALHYKDQQPLVSWPGGACLHSYSGDREWPPWKSCLSHILQPYLTPSRPIGIIAGTWRLP